VFPVFKIGVELSEDISPKSRNRKKEKKNDSGGFEVPEARGKKK
jgi:hypothetical protein